MMTSILAALAWPFFQAFTLFMYFLAFLTVYRAHLNGNLAKATPLTRAVCGIVVGIGAVVDVTFNLTVGTIALLEWPRQATFTQRCSSHLGEPGWRGDLCRKVCSQLDLFQEGGHCK
jgi:hypothetical protein